MDYAPPAGRFVGMNMLRRIPRHECLVIGEQGAAYSCLSEISISLVVLVD